MHEPAVVQKERLLAGLSVVLAAIGIAIGWFAFRSQPLRRMPKILEEKWRIDEFYNGYIVDPITSLSRQGLWKGFDLGVIDGVVHGIGGFVVEVGNLVRRVQVGFVRSYAAIILLGAGGARILYLLRIQIGRMMDFLTSNLLTILIVLPAIGSSAGRASLVRKARGAAQMGRTLCHAGKFHRLPCDVLGFGHDRSERVSV